MSGKADDIDAAIERVLLLRPGASPSQIRTLANATARLSDGELSARVERLRMRLVRKSVARSKTRDAYD